MSENTGMVWVVNFRIADGEYVEEDAFTYEDALRCAYRGLINHPDWDDSARVTEFSDRDYEDVVTEEFFDREWIKDNPQYA